MTGFSDPYVGIHERHMRVLQSARLWIREADGVNRSQMQLLET
jgi:hypothetical protein